MLRAYFEVAPKDIWSDLKGDQLNFTLSQRKARKKKKKTLFLPKSVRLK